MRELRRSSNPKKDYVRVCPTQLNNFLPNAKRKQILTFVILRLGRDWIPMTAIINDNLGGTEAANCPF